MENMRERLNIKWNQHSQEVTDKPVGETGWIKTLTNGAYER